MGYNTTVMAYTDVYTAMQTGTVDGEWAGGPTLNYYNFKDVLNYFVDYRGALDIYMMVMNQELFQSMPEEYQTAIKEAADEATEFGNELLAQQDEELIQKMQDEGITVFTPTDEQRAEMQKYFKENVWPDITAPFNQDLVKELTAE
jgi:TRAP-type C4-dicarboxylate transport system substrate-binding protein